MILPIWMGPLGILIAIVLIIFLAMRGYSILLIGPLAAVLVIVLNNMEIYPALISGPTAYMMGLSKYIINYFAIFLLGSIMAKYIEVSGAAKSIAKSVMKVTGTDKPFSLLIAIFFISAIMTYGGISLFVVIFAVIPLARPIFKQMDMAWNLIVIPVMLGVGTFTMTMFPGTPSIQNVIPTTTLNTTLTAAPVLGIIGSVAAIAFGIWYMKFEFDKSVKNGVTYASFDDSANLAAENDEHLPSVFTSIFPMLLLVVIILAGSIMKVPNVILIGLLAACLASVAVFHKYVLSHKDVLNLAAQGSINPIFLTAAAVGFGTVVTAAPGFAIISQYILSIPGNPLISLSVATALMSIVTGSSSGALAIIVPAFGQNYIDLGIQPEVIHRVVAIASAAFTAMPHSGIVLTFFAVCRLNHKNAMKYMFVLMTGSNVAALVAVLFSAIVLNLT
ncbi:GntP family permease [Trichococcus sp. K1Tr]|uniref:GntP family permease n=1 Tax=Trichococcus sp. K1Tr TaxID=3020847 RepID=UPI00232AF11C|nr:GntP family permease [Trichococcus sp. K1Tr]MDB6353003.1 GntP family permease [Trichococcus sp. K1Tr]